MIGTPPGAARAPEAGVVSLPGIGIPGKPAGPGEPDGPGEALETAPALRQRPWWARPGERAAIFAAVAVPGLALAYALAFGLHVYTGDALSRTYQAAAVFHADPARLANLSFIWPPLPVVAQLPLVLFRPLALNGFAGQIVSVLFAAGSLVLLSDLLARFGLSRGWRYALLAAYQLNPMILVYTLNGMSESLMIFWVLLGVRSLHAFAAQPEAINFQHLMAIGFAGAMAFLTRYEGVGFGAALAAATVIFSLPREPDVQTGSDRLEARLVAVTAPWAYAMFFWVLMNWIIMGDPLYFLTGRGSNRDQALALVAENDRIRQMVGNPAASLGYVALLVAHTFPAVYPVGALLLWRARRRGDGLALALTAVTLSFPALQVLLHIAGQSFGWMRFHIYVIPLTVVAAAYLAAEERRDGWGGAAPAAARSGVPLALGAAVLVLILSSAATGIALGSPWIERFNEGAYLRALAGRPVPEALGPERAMGQHLRDLLAREPGARILHDELRSDSLVVFAGPSRGFVGTRHPLFRQYLEDPAAAGVQYLLASDRGDGSDVVAVAMSRAAAGLYPVDHRVEGPAGRTWTLYRVPSRADLRAG